MFSREALELPRTRPSDGTSQVISQDCCYHCLTRGGNAAYECAKEGGEDRCSRCIRDKRAKCRLPTAQEEIKIAARCPRCTKRGFKQCNGGNPCDTCIRNNTEGFCHATSKESRQSNKRSNDATSGTVVSNTVSRTEKAGTRRSTRIQSHQSFLEITETENKVSSVVSSPTRAHATRCKKLLKRKVIAVKNGTHCLALSPSVQEDIFSERNHQGFVQIQESTHRSSLESTSASPQLSHSANQLSERSPSQILGRKRKATQSEPARPFLRNHFARPNDRNNATTDPPGNLDTNMIESIDSYQVDAFRNNHRPRRSQKRVSYAEILADAEMDYLNAINNDSDTDIYIAHTTDEDEDEDDDEDEDEDKFLIGEPKHCKIENGDLEIPEDMLSDSCDDDEEDRFMKILTNRFVQKKVRTVTKPKAGKGIDLSLPPLDNITSCFSDLASKALSHGFGEALSKLGSTTLKVATMCSGTESPLLALNEISRGLRELGRPGIKFQHEFSAEIEPVKQAYIERNFQPQILFRDVRDFLRVGTTTATTAYGAEVEIPSKVDILIAGFVCKDLSRLNNSGKTLKDEGESGETWLAIYTYAQRFRPSVVLLENVKATRKTWDDLVVEWDEIGYTAAWLYRDTKTYYLPQTRERMYMIAIERSEHGPIAEEAVNGWKYTIQKLQRQCSSPYESFITGSLWKSCTYTTPLLELDWPLCKLRYDHIRSRLKLGNLSPVTLSSGSGTVKPPDCASIQYYEAQSSRIWDAIDIAHLKVAKDGSDSLYKMIIWDVSQNVDRFKVELGIVPCITPGGCDFATNRQQPLSGSQLLTLQGMPLDRLLFTNETQRDRQDLAGNAMSTTVIGASLIAAITSCWQTFQSRRQCSPDSTHINRVRDGTTKWLEVSDSLQKSSQKAETYSNVDLTALKDEARRSARLCHCEGTELICKSLLHKCLSCEHTACTACAGNPKHDYDSIKIKSCWRIAPDMFIQSWRSKLPPRVRFEQFINLDNLATDEKFDKEYLHVVREAQLDSEYFCIGEFSRRTHNWIITYSSPKATLELEIGRKFRWLLYIKCPAELAGHNPLRRLLKTPIAYAEIGESLFHLRWELQSPSGTQYQLCLNSSDGQSRSWRARLGLLDYLAETVPLQINVQCNDQNLSALNGQFNHLPNCGTASSCLYKRSSDPPLYMFLDPDPIGPSKADSVIFSYDCSRKHYGEGRITIASIDSSWRPWTMAKGKPSYIAATQPGNWHSVVMSLSSACGTVDAYHLVNSHLSPASVRYCSRVLTCLDVHIHERIPTYAFQAYSWALEKPKILPSFSGWQEVETNFARECDCAPPYPELHWNVDEKGVATAHENRKTAAVFERAIKCRPSAIQIKVTAGSDHTRIQVGVNVASLLHRASASIGCDEPVTTAWRLLTDHVDIPAQPLTTLHLRSNSTDTIATSALPSYLGSAQAKSLAWMIQQEQGKNMVITEVEEETHTGLGWRLEGRAQATRTVRGGMLADRPSFGKTVTTIALIQNEFNLNSPEAIVAQNSRNSTTEASSLFNIAATLVVCPPHIAPQWRTEFGKFSETNGLKLDEVLLIEDYAGLKKLTADHLQNSKVVVVSWTVLADEEYISQLAQFTAMPEPILTSRRAYDTWLSRVSDEIPKRLIAFRDQDYQEFWKSTTKLLRARLQQPQFQATLPLKIGHGSAYEPFKSTQPPSRQPQKAMARVKSSFIENSARSHRQKEVPLLHLFNFNRIVVDEYHYLNDEKNKNFLSAIGVKKIAAHKRWVLSGTPTMANFSDINQVASFLGISLGRTFLGDGAITSQTDKLVKADQTPVEDFLARTEIKTQQWHQARHGLAQSFLDMFVRQNEAELQHIACSEMLHPVQLDAAHLAVYLELSQHLIAQKMQLKKLSRKMGSDKAERLNESMNNSESAEIALIKSALIFETCGGQPGLQFLRRRRVKQRLEAEGELESILSGMEGLIPTEKKRLRRLFKQNRQAFNSRVDESIVSHYIRFKEDIGNTDWLGDDETSNNIRSLLARAMKQPNQKKFARPEGLSDEKHQRILKQELSRVRELSRELAMRIRSGRFIDAVERASSQSTIEQAQQLTCNSPDCIGASTREDMYIITQCGHTACKRCLESPSNEEGCIHPNCNSPVHRTNLVRVSDLNFIGHQSHHGRFGNKLAAIAELVLGFPADDQGIVFVQNEEFVGILGNVFGCFGITFHSITRTKAAQSARNIEDFKTNRDVGKRKQMLILNLGSESAAGVNLVNANHIVFVSPLSAGTQDEYDSAMVQAIARSRRYGQQKQVHIYHVVAEQTIDVDILERRHKRDDGITTMHSTMKLPKALGAAKERTRLIKNKQGQVALVPRSWLNDETKRQMLDVDEELKSLTSLLSFSGNSEHDDE